MPVHDLAVLLDGRRLDRRGDRADGALHVAGVAIAQLVGDLLERGTPGPHAQRLGVPLNALLAPHPLAAAVACLTDPRRYRR
jgi:hypothetical protein